MPISGQAGGAPALDQQEAYLPARSTALAAAAPPPGAKNVVPVFASGSGHLLDLALCVLFHVRQRIFAVGDAAPIERVARIVLEQKSVRQRLYFQHVEVT